MAAAAPDILISNVTGLYPVKVAKVVAPTSSAEVANAVRSWPGKVGIGGGRYSMGGQVAITGGLRLDMRGMNKLVKLDPGSKVAGYRQACAGVTSRISWTHSGCQ